MKTKIVDFLKNIANSVDAKKDIKQKFIKRADQGLLTKDENPKNHLCVYFAAFDPIAKQVFIGHHKKSNLWLFNGGHVDKGELPLESLKREISEEWGNNVIKSNEYFPSLLTITKLNNIGHSCRIHHDIWYFISVNKNNFFPESNLLEIEFYQNGWKTIKEAKELLTEKNNLLALEKIEKLF